MQPKLPLVSIVIPTYNQPQYILRAVESALHQDYENLEVIVSDDSSNDESEQILKAYISENKIRYYHNNPRLGRVKNYRTGLYNLAQGEWTLNLDGDDYLTDMQFISSAIHEMLQTNETIAFIQAGGSILDENGKLLEKRMPNCEGKSRVLSGEIYLNEFAKKRRFLHLTSLYNTKIAREIDFYRFDNLSSDLEAFMRLALMGNVLLLNKDVGVWFQHSNNTSTNSSSDAIIENTKWTDSVAKFAIQNKKMSSLKANWWKEMVKQQELTGLFMKDIKRANSKKTKLKLAGKVLRNHPKTFFFPVFLKKFLFDLI